MNIGGCSWTLASFIHIFKNFFPLYFIVFTVHVLTYFLIFIPKYFIIFYLQHMFNYVDSTSKILQENIL